MFVRDFPDIPLDEGGGKKFRKKFFEKTLDKLEQALYK